MVTFLVRAEPPSKRNPQGTPERRLAARYSRAELALMGTRFGSSTRNATSPRRTPLRR